MRLERLRANRKHRVPEMVTVAPGGIYDSSGQRFWLIPDLPLLPRGSGDSRGLETISRDAGLGGRTFGLTDLAIRKDRASSGRAAQLMRGLYPMRAARSLGRSGRIFQVRIDVFNESSNLLTNWGKTVPASGAYARKSN